MASSKRWSRISTLVAGWAAYWVLLTGIKLGPAIAAILRSVNASEGGGSVNLSYGDGAFLLTVVNQGRTTYSGSTGLLALSLWIAVPPLLMLTFWLARRSSAKSASSAQSAPSA